MMEKFTAEKQLQEPLLAWLHQKRRVDADSEVFEEVPWFGRRIDLVTVTQSRRVTAYELKLNSFRRAVEQAAYNRIAFDRAYVVTAAYPKSSSLELAIDVGVGVIVIDANGVKEISASPMKRAAQEIRQRLLATIREIREDVPEPVFALS